MTDKVNPEKFTADFVVNPDGLVIHGSGPNDGSYAMRSAKRAVGGDRPTIKVDRQDTEDGAILGIELGVPLADRVDICPTCGLNHEVHGVNDLIKHALQERGRTVTCSDLIDEAREILPAMDPEQHFTEIELKLLLPVDIEGARSLAEKMVEVADSKITASLTSTELPFLLAVRAVLETVQTANAIETVGELSKLADEAEAQAETQQSVTDQARNN